MILQINSRARWPKTKPLIDPISKTKYLPQEIDGKIEFAVSDDYGKRLLEATPELFIVKKEKTAKVKDPGDYHKMKYRELSKYYQDKTGKSAFGKKSDQLIKELDDLDGDKKNQASE
jgi:hypothetical protein